MFACTDFNGDIKWIKQQLKNEISKISSGPKNISERSCWALLENTMFIGFWTTV